MNVLLTALSPRTGALGSWRFTGSGANTGIPSLQAMNHWHFMSLFLPFTLAHICSYSCVTKKDYLSAGGKERVQRQQQMPEAAALMLEQLRKTHLEEKPAPHQGSVKGLLGDRCVAPSASCHQPLHSLSPWH